ncbi:ABC transporter substrate-binding protein [Paenibacillus methanolicus]|uniref:ABC-type glycerol-3-phosphate transport system substrate-binding protein n=1 Tax=Paenibacillus methanolicus TaxID=582686 RepID=A0A5S5CLB1_9BACL|nr:extracellular solute-binding protein [Paenibacillus methanolicus]TYP79743.1 ABC-type glycerol-3-phosphate transport system substrate-binding protein [Paenibacillus methanolicus]
MDVAWRYMKMTVSVIVAGMLAAGCSGTGNEEGQANKEPAGGSVIESTGAASKLTVLTNRIDLMENGTMDAYAREFEQSHPGVDIRFEGLTNYESDVMMRLATRTAGDVLLLPNQLSTKELSGYFEPLPATMFENVHFADFKSYQGNRYGIATGISSDGIVYNKRAFAAAGVTEVPRTLEEFYEACRRLKDKGIVPVYINYGAQWPMTEWGERLVSFMTGDPNTLNRMAEVDDPWRTDNAWGQALTIVRTLVDKGYTERDLMSNSWETSKAELASGRAAMYLMGNWSIKQVIEAGAKPEDIGFFPFPYDNDADRRYAPISPDWFVGISKFSENKPLAEAWITFFVRESGYVEQSGFLSVETNKEPTLPQYKEFLSYDPILLESTVPSETFLSIANKAKIAFWSGDFIQELVAAKILDEGFQAMNAKWKEARARR